MLFCDIPKNITIHRINIFELTPEELLNKFESIIDQKIDDLKSFYQPKEPTEYLTRNEVARLLSVDLSTLHNWNKKGKLTSYGIGHRVYYTRHEVESMLKPLNVISDK